MSQDFIEERLRNVAQLMALDELLRDCEANMEKTPAELEQLRRLRADLLENKRTCIRRVA
jgi:hypothetical protein